MRKYALIYLCLFLSCLILSEFSFADFTVIERRRLGEWVGYLLAKNS